jgi:hypothetical protein
MALVIREIHAAENAEELNQEWIVVENTGVAPLHTGGLRLSVSAPKAKPRDVGTFDPGFLLPPGGRRRIVSGSLGKKSHGMAPEDGTPNYFLFFKVGWLEKPESLVRIFRNQLELAQAMFDPKENTGIRPA